MDTIKFRFTQDQSDFLNRECGTAFLPGTEYSLTWVEIHWLERSCCAIVWEKPFSRTPREFTERELLAKAIADTLYLARKGKNTVPCPVCGTVALKEIGDYDICPRCGWEDDPFQRDDPDCSGGANGMVSLNEARRLWAEGKRVWTPDPPKKPEKTLRLRYVGESFGDGVKLTNGKIYEAWLDEEGDSCLIDDSGYDHSYPRQNPGAWNGMDGGRWEIVEE